MRSLRTLETLGGKKNSFTKNSSGFPMTHLISNGSCRMHSTYCYSTIPYVHTAGMWWTGSSGGRATAVGCGCLSKVDNEGWWLRHLIWKEMTMAYCSNQLHDVAQSYSSPPWLEVEPSPLPLPPCRDPTGCSPFNYLCTGTIPPRAVQRTYAFSSYMEEQLLLCAVLDPPPRESNCI